MDQHGLFMPSHCKLCLTQFILWSKWNGYFCLGHCLSLELPQTVTVFLILHFSLICLSFLSNCISHPLSLYFAFLWVSLGYVEAVVIPKGARRIRVVEQIPTQSYLGKIQILSFIASLWFSPISSPRRKRQPSDIFLSYNRPFSSTLVACRIVISKQLGAHMNPSLGCFVTVKQVLLTTLKNA